jgi:hypothetical protein
MKNQRYLFGVFLLFFALAFAHSAFAQDAQKNEGKATIEGKAGDTNFDIRVQGRDADRNRPAREGREGVPGPQGPAGQPGPQGPSGPSGPSGGQVLGMDPTIALLVGLGVLAVVIVAIVAASRGREH